MKREKNETIVYAFIDSQNINLSVKQDVDRKRKRIYNGWKLDFKKFYIYLRDKYSVKKAFLFIGYRSEYKKLYSFLKAVGYQLVFKPTLDRAGITKGNVDAELVLQAMIEYPKYSQAIIVSGDGDFHCLIKYLLEKKKLYRLLIPNEFSYSSLLRKFTRIIAFISRLKEKLEYQKN